MKLLIFLLLPCIVSAQVVNDSVIVTTPTGQTIRYIQPVTYATSTAGASLIARETNGKKSLIPQSTFSLTSHTHTGVYAPVVHTHTQAEVTGVVSFAQGGISGAAAAPATTGVMTIPMTSSVITIQPTGTCTFNASGGVAGQVVTFSITTSGTSSFVLTFGTNFRKVGTLATGTVSARFFSVTFICINGTIWQEVSRTAIQT